MGVTVRARRKKHIDIPDKITGPMQVKVGFPAGKVDGDIVSRAIWNHFGTSRGIPSRPFLLNAMRKNRAKYLSAMKSAAKKILRGEEGTEMTLRRLGILAQGDVQSEITDLRSPPNAPSTIKKKGSSNPLIDTGEMRQAVTYKVDGS
jgi:hypothetical protein